MKVVFDDTPIDYVKCCECGRRMKKKKKQGYQNTKKGKIEKFLCGRCLFKSKKITNKWYDARFDKSFIGKFSMNTQEWGFLIKKYKMRGLTYAEAKKKVEYNMRGMSQIKYKQKYDRVKEKVKEEGVKQEAKQMQERLVKGLNTKG